MKRLCFEGLAKFLMFYPLTFFYMIYTLSTLSLITENRGITLPTPTK